MARRKQWYYLIYAEEGGLLKTLRLEGTFSQVYDEFKKIKQTRQIRLGSTQYTGYIVFCALVKEIDNYDFILKSWRK